MNWTGGILQRQKKWGKSQQNKQQEHFANVRTKLQHGAVDDGSWLPSFISDGRGDSGSSKKRARQSSGRQSKLGEYGNMAPVVNRLRSLSPRKTDHGSATHSSRTSRKVQPLSDYDDGLNGQSHEYRNVEAIVKSRRHGPDFLYEPPPRSTRNRQTSDHEEEARGPNMDTSAKGRVKNNDGNTYDDSASQASPTPSDELELKRRRLLDQSDWLSLDRSKPLHMSFASDRGKERVAKRRKLDNQDHLRKEAARLARHRVSSIRDQYMMRGALQPNAGPRDDSSIRIRIGDAALISQTDAASRIHGATVTTMSTSPDSMLLDEEFHGSLSFPKPDSNPRAELRSTGSSRECNRRDFEDQQGIDEAAAHQDATEGPRIWKQAPSEQLTGESQHRVVHLSHAEDQDFARPIKTPIAMTSDDVDNQPASRSSAVLAGAVSTHGAVHGSIVSATCSQNRSPVRQGSVAEERTGTDGAWLSFMDIYTEADAASTTTGPTSLAFTNIRRGIREPIESGMQAQRKHQPAPSVWDVPDTPPKLFAIPTHKKPDFSLPRKVAESSAGSITALPLRNKAQPDPDAAWKAFVFGNDNDSAPSTASDAPDRECNHLEASLQEAKKPHAAGVPSLSALDATKFGSSSFLTSSSGVGPPSVGNRRAEGKGTSSPTKSSFPYDRPSSIANASTTATVLHARSLQHKARRGTFSPPKRHGSTQDRSADDEDEYQVEDIEDSD